MPNDAINRTSPLAAQAAAAFRQGRFEEARAGFEAVLELDSQHAGAHWGMYELEQIAHDIPRALVHQRAALRQQTLFSEYAPRERRRVLALLAPGDWQANVPIDFLVDRQSTTLHKLFLVSPEQAAAARLPAADVIFNAIAESDESRELLEQASQLIGRARLPYVNDPQKVLGTNRVALYRALRDISNVIAPETQRCARAELEALDAPAFPLVVRPVGSQAGRDLARIDDRAQLAAYLHEVQAHEFFTMPFVDFCLPDGYYRKYRIIVVDGAPYPYHLAVSPRWMIHYYNAPMREHAWMREEEVRFLSEFESVFTPPILRALREVARAVGLEYFGIDCSIDREGRLVIFEADPAMLVHASDDPEMFGYKRSYAQRIFTAFEELLDRARSG